MSETAEIEIIENHTPGPWLHKESSGQMKGWYVDDGIGAIDITGQIRSNCGAFCEEAKANARLIAQAPAMQQEIIRLREENAEQQERIEALQNALEYAISKLENHGFQWEADQVADRQQEADRSRSGGAS